MPKIFKRLGDFVEGRLPATRSEWYDLMTGSLLALSISSALFWLIGTIYLDVTAPSDQQQHEIHK